MSCEEDKAGPNEVYYPGIGYMRVSPMRIGWLWNTPERFAFQRDAKGILKEQLESGEVDLKLIWRLMQVDESWIKIKQGEYTPANYPLMLYLWNQYKQLYTKFKPPLIYRLGLNKIAIMFLTMYKEDKAYTTRIGGMIQCHLLEYADEWAVKDNRLMLLHDLRDWWYEEDWRDYGKSFIDGAFKFVIDKYEHEPFMEKTIDWFIDNMLHNKEHWDRYDDVYPPDKWYPRGYGQVNYLVHNRTA